MQSAFVNMFWFGSENLFIKAILTTQYVACVAGGMRASGGGAAIFLAGEARKGFRERRSRE